jgi:hypothetical protein
MHSHLGIDHTEIVMNITDVRIDLYRPQKVPECLLIGFFSEINDPQIIQTLNVFRVSIQNCTPRWIRRIDSEMRELRLA